MNNFIIKVAAYAHGIWLHRWSVLGITTLIAFSGWLLIKSLPETYHSHISVYVEYKTSSDQPFKNIKTTLLDQKYLQLILEKSGHSSSDPRTMDQRMTQLRQNLSVVSDNPSKNASQPETIDIDYVSYSPEKTFAIINTISNILSLGFSSTDQQNFASISDEMIIRVLEYPQKTIPPYRQNRPLLLTGSSLIAILAGALWGITRYRFSPMFSDYRQLRKRIKLPVLGVVDLHKSPEMLKRQKLDIFLFSLACIGILLFMILAITYH